MGQQIFVVNLELEVSGHSIFLSELIFQKKFEDNQRINLENELICTGAWKYISTYKKFRLSAFDGYFIPISSEVIDQNTIIYLRYKEVLKPGKTDKKGKPLMWNYKKPSWRLFLYTLFSRNAQQAFKDLITLKEALTTEYMELFVADGWKMISRDGA